LGQTVDRKFGRFNWREADGPDKAHRRSCFGPSSCVQILDKSWPRDGDFFNACPPMMHSFKTKKSGNGGVVFKPEFAMLRLLTDFWSSESGATAIEYGLIVVGISMTIIAAVNSVGNSLKADLAASAAGINP